MRAPRARRDRSPAHAPVPRVRIPDPSWQRGFPRFRALSELAVAQPFRRPPPLPDKSRRGRRPGRPRRATTEGGGRGGERGGREKGGPLRRRGKRRRRSPEHAGGDPQVATKFKRTRRPRSPTGRARGSATRQIRSRARRSGRVERSFATLRQTRPRPGGPRAQGAFKDSMIRGILQFALRIAFRCALHRGRSRDIHRWELYFNLWTPPSRADKLGGCRARRPEREFDWVWGLG